MTSFFVEGKPQGKARPRVVRHNDRVVTYTPSNTVVYEERVLQKCRESMAEDRQPLIEGPVRVTIYAHFQIPKSASKETTQKMVEGKMLPTKKPDCDNIAKIICDALNGVAYKDDSQITNLSVIKQYTSAREGVYVLIEESKIL